MYFVIYLLGI